ncbi:MAG: ABC transporter ATP-binding protein [Thermoplasmata archaeon]|nr:ABC transporter ATP-binding protein [Thermoplasmata archaeon]
MGSFEVSGLSKSFRTGPPALSDLSFRYEGAGAIGYLGPNGAGKTTTLKLLVGLLRPSRGHAFVNEIDPMIDRKGALWDVGALIETPEPYPTLNVQEALDVVGRARGLSRDDIDREVDRCHELLDLPPLDLRIGWLSKGQRQRVALAATLMGDPSVLLLDEPTSGLDPAERVLVRRLLNRLKRDHLVFMSSHQMFEVTEVCDQLVFLNQGRILLKDRVDRVSDRIRALQVDVEFERPVAAEATAALRTIATDVVAISERRWRISFDGSDQNRVRLLELCQGIGPVAQFSNTSLVLEEAYLELLSKSASEA